MDISVIMFLNIAITLPNHPVRRMDIFASNNNNNNQTIIELAYVCLYVIMLTFSS